jgi:type IV pilus assembly protein PilC
LWQLLLMALTSGRPLADSLRYHQSRFNGGFGRRFRHLLVDLDRGVSWSNAVGANRRIFPPEAPSYAALLATSPTVAADASMLAKPRDAAYVEVRQQIVQRLSYLGMSGFMMLAVFTFVMIKIVPSFQSIFEDFDLQLPAVTSFVIAVGNWFEHYMLAPSILILAVLLMAAAAIGILYLCGVPVLRPVIDRLTFPYHQAQILRLLAVAFRQSLPIGDAFQRVEAGVGAYSSPLARRRLQSAHAISRSGRTWIDALRMARLITNSDATSLIAAQHVGNLPWAMEFLADRKMRLLGFHWSAIVTLLFTFIVLCFGFVVFWFAVAMIVPLTDLIWNLSS